MNIIFHVSVTVNKATVAGYVAELGCDEGSGSSGGSGLWGRRGGSSRCLLLLRLVPLHVSTTTLHLIEDSAGEKRQKSQCNVT